MHSLFRGAAGDRVGQVGSLSARDSLAAILQDAQTSAAITDHSWKSIGREANSLANGIISDLANTFRAQHKIALEVHHEVFAMRSAAGRDRNAEEARAHARKALVPLAKLLEWSAPR